MPEFRKKQQRAINDLSDFIINVFYGTKQLVGTDPVFLSLLKRVLSQKTPTGASHASKFAEDKAIK